LAYFILSRPPSRTRCATHNLGRAGGLRRPLRVPNPSGFILLAEEIEKLWPELSRHFHKVALSRSWPSHDNSNERAVIPRLSMSEIPGVRARTWPGLRYILSTDISQFYASIYTHSIPWALHGKSYAKANLGKTPADALDKAIQRTQEGQTMGVPIGPDSSLIIAEIVLAAVDVELVAKVGRLVGFRYLDDYELAFRSLAECEHALAALEGILSTFELRLNPLKTAIDEVPRTLQSPWVSSLARFPIRRATPRQTINDTVALFSHAFELAAVNPGAGVLKYALQACRNVSVAEIGWRTLQGLVISAVAAEPSSAPVAFDLIDHHAAALGQPVGKRSVSQLIEAMILRNAGLGNGSEVAWALWAALHWNIRMTGAAADVVSQMEDDFVALLALDADARDLFARPLNTARWATFAAAPGALKNEHWLLTYEANQQGWLKAGGRAIARDPFFRALSDAGVRFYAATRYGALFTGAAATVPGGILRHAYI
jgi:hypothetical protein